MTHRTPHQKGGVTNATRIALSAMRSSCNATGYAPANQYFNAWEYASSESARQASWPWRKAL